MHPNRLVKLSDFKQVRGTRKEKEEEKWSSFHMARPRTTFKTTNWIPPTKTGIVTLGSISTLTKRIIIFFKKGIRFLILKLYIFSSSTITL